MASISQIDLFNQIKFAKNDDLIQKMYNSTDFTGFLNSRIPLCDLYKQKLT